MDSSVFGEIEELATCACCKRAFDDGKRAPKVLACQHHFCLECTRSALGHCVHCWNRTVLPDGRADALPTHGGALALARHLATVATPPDALALHVELRRVGVRRRDFLLRALEATTALKLRLEAELKTPDICSAAPAYLRARLCEALQQSRLDDLVRTASAPLDAEAVRRALAGSAVVDSSGDECRDPILFLANFCTAWLHSQGEEVPAPSPLARRPSGYPLFYFDLEVNGAGFGRVVVEVRDDVAPRMARNFSALATGSAGVGYRGCAVFQCWENESVIAGDFELNNGRGGRSAFEESYFMPDDTKMAAVRGSVGMRRSQRRRDNLGLVGSQFRVILREMRGFSAIFASVVEGLELVDRLSRTGDGTGKPHGCILISDCGKLN